MAKDLISQLLTTDVALDKLGARGISAAEAEQVPRNRHAMARNPRGPKEHPSGCCSLAASTVVAP